MANKFKAKGTTWETKIVNALAKIGIRAKRRVLSGGLDKGDIELLDFPLIIEAKNCKKMELSEWVDEAEKEAQNAGVPFGVVWHHRPRRAEPEDGYVTLRGQTFMNMVDYMMK